MKFSATFFCFSCLWPKYFLGCLFSTYTESGSETLGARL